MSTVSTVITRILMEFLSNNKALTVSIAIMALTISIQDTAFPYILKKWVEFLPTKKSARRPWNGMAIRFSFLFVFTILVVQLFKIIDDKLTGIFDPKLFTFVRKKMIECLMIKHDDFIMHSDIDTGDIATRFVRIPSIFVELTALMIELLPHVLALLTTSIYLYFFVDRVIAFIMIVVSCILIYIILHKFSKCSKLSIDRDENVIKSQSLLDDITRNIYSIFSSNNTRLEIDRLSNKDNMQNISYSTLVNCNLESRVSYMVVMFSAFVLILFRSYIVRMDGPSLSALILIIMLIFSTHTKLLKGSSDWIRMYGVIKVSGTDILSCSTPSSDLRIRKCRPVPLPDGLILSVNAVTLKGVMNAYVTFNLTRGERLAIVGPIGCGKSTLLKIVMGFASPSVGEIRLHGVPYASLSKEDIRVTFAYVPQVPILFNTTVYDNICYGIDPIKCTHDTIMNAAKTLGFDMVIENLSHGLETQVGKSGSKLSGGQRQVVLLIRAWMMDRRVLVLDEPTASMDPEHAMTFAKAVCRFETILFVSHDMSFVDAVATRRVQMMSLTSSSQVL